MHCVSACFRTLVNMYTNLTTNDLSIGYWLFFLFFKVVHYLKYMCMYFSSLIKLSLKYTREKTFGQVYTITRLISNIAMVIICSDLFLYHSCTCCISQAHLCFLYCRQRSSLSCSSLSCTITRLRLTSWLMSCRRRRVRRRGRTGSGSGSRRRSRRRRRSRARRPGSWPKWSSPLKNRSVHPLSEPGVLFVDVLFLWS